MICIFHWINQKNTYVAFIVKYEHAAKQRHLPLHTDQSILSLTIALNSADNSIDMSSSNNSKTLDETAIDEISTKGVSVNDASAEVTFSGGGTYFESLKATIVPSQGSLVVFPGELSHGGKMITGGVRYIIALFLYIYEEEQEGGGGGCQWMRNNKDINEDVRDNAVSCVCRPCIYLFCATLGFMMCV